MGELPTTIPITSSTSSFALIENEESQNFSSGEEFIFEEDPTQECRSSKNNSRANKSSIVY